MSPKEPPPVAADHSAGGPMTSMKDRGPRAWPPPAQSLVLIMVFAGVWWGLGVGAADTSQGSREFVSSIAWLTWKVLAAATIVVMAVLLVYGVYVLLFLRPFGPSGKQAGLALGVAVLLGAGCITLMQLRAGWIPNLPVRNLSARTHAVVYAGVAAAVPWLAASWLVQTACQRHPHPELSSGADTPATLSELLRIWSHINRVVGVFACGVVAALLTSGALRLAFLVAHPVCGAEVTSATRPAGLVCAEDFPATYVLFYGAAFAGFLLAVSVPMVVSWRNRALAWVELQNALPDDVPDQQWCDTRARLEKLLHLDTPFLRNPVTLLSVFLPLVTSLLAAFLPQLAGKG